MKQKLLAVVADARRKEGELQAACTEMPADPDGRWHAKDHIAHAAWWRERDGMLIDALRTGSPPPPAVGSREVRDEGRQNEVIYEMYRDVSLPEILQYAGSAWNSFTRAAEACSEEDLSRPHPYRADEVLWQTALGICYHTGEHLTYWYADAGDEAHVEATQKWLRDIYVSVASDAKSRANANYNLACYYARNGRVDDALPLLRQSFTIRPELVAHARKDPDIDPIRRSAELVELLA